MANYYESGRTLISPPPSDWEVPQDRPEEVEGIEQCLPGEDDHPSDDYQGLKRLVVDRFNSRAHFIEPNQTPTGQQADPDNRSWRATLYSTQGLTVPAEDPRFPRKPLGICRQDDEVYTYVSHPVLSAACPQPNFMQPFPVSLSNEEIVNIGKRMGDPSLLYCVSPADPKSENRRSLFLRADSEGTASRLESLAEEIQDDAGNWGYKNWGTEIPVLGYGIAGLLNLWGYFTGFGFEDERADTIAGGLEKLAAPIIGARNPWWKQAWLAVFGTFGFWMINKGAQRRGEKVQREMMRETRSMREEDKVWQEALVARGEQFHQNLMNRVEGRNAVNDPLKTFTVDWSERIQTEGAVPYIGREDEVRAIMSRWADPKQPGMLITAAKDPKKPRKSGAGVGKSAGWKEAVRRINTWRPGADPALRDYTVPPELRGARILEVPEKLLRAGKDGGAMHAGEYEGRLIGVLNGARQAAEPTVLIFEEAKSLFIQPSINQVEPIHAMLTDLEDRPSVLPENVAGSRQLDVSHKTEVQSDSAARLTLAIRGEGQFPAGGTIEVVNANLDVVQTAPIPAAGTSLEVEVPIRPDVRSDEREYYRIVVKDASGQVVNRPNNWRATAFPLTRSEFEETFGAPQWDNALRRVGKLYLNEPNPEQTTQWLLDARDQYETLWRVKIHESAIRAAVRLGEIYEPDGSNPGKAIAILRDAANSLRERARQAGGNGEIPELSDQNLEELFSTARGVKREDLAAARGVHERYELAQGRFRESEERQGILEAVRRVRMDLARDPGQLEQVAEALWAKWRGLSDAERVSWLEIARRDGNQQGSFLFARTELLEAEGNGAPGSNGTAAGNGAGAAPVAPEAPDGTGNGAHANGEVPVTEDYIAMELRDRFPAFENPHHRIAAAVLARDIMADWERNGRPQSANGSAIPGLPPEELIEQHFDRFVRLAETRRDAQGREVMATNRGRRAERGKEDLARRIFEHFRHAAEEARRAGAAP